MNTTTLLMKLPGIGSRLLNAKVRLRARGRRGTFEPFYTRFNVPHPLRPVVGRLLVKLVHQAILDDQTCDGMMFVPERVVLAKYAAELQPGQAAVELGVFSGVGTCFLAAGVRHGEGRGVWAVDTFHGTSTIDWEKERYEKTLAMLGNSTFKIFQTHLKMCGVQDVVHPIINATAAAGHEWHQGPIGLLLIDADHTYESCLSDYQAWRPHLADNAIVMFHDYQPGFPGVQRCVDELMQYGDVELIETVSVMKICRFRGKLSVKI